MYTILKLTIAKCQETECDYTWIDKTNNIQPKSKGSAWC